MSAVLNLAMMMLKLRFELQTQPARRQPYRVYDRVKHKTVASFTSMEDATRFRDGLINTRSLEVSHAVSTGNFLPWVEDAPYLQDLQGQQRADDGALSLSAV